MDRLVTHMDLTRAHLEHLGTRLDINTLEVHRFRFHLNFASQFLSVPMSKVLFRAVAKQQVDRVLHGLQQISLMSDGVQRLLATRDEQERKANRSDWRVIETRGINHVETPLSFILPNPG